MVLPKADIILMVDFNDLNENGRVPASMSLDVIGSVKPRVGDWVWLVDEEGPNCLGRVDVIDDELIEVKPFGSTMEAPTRITREGYRGEYSGRGVKTVKTEGGQTIGSLA